MHTCGGGAGTSGGATGAAGAPAGDPRRGVPRTDALLADPRLAAAEGRLGRELVRASVHAALAEVRAGRVPAAAAADTAVALLPPGAAGLRPVLNATGVVVHTNLGRAPLSAAAVEALAAAAGYTDVEYDLGTGARARRGRGALAALAERLPEAGGVHVVNNGAAALLLAVAGLCAGREVVWSRGEMVEIGDGFRLPDLVAASGAVIREVGTTNRTHLADYREALTERTGAILKVHPSNFQVTGFASSVAVADLAGLGVPVIVDVGSGLLVPDPALPGEPDVTTALRGGATVVTGSGDKLLGGPQAGLLAGQREVVERLRRHPLARALRVDKLTLAALEATLRGPTPPVRAALAAQPDRLRARAEALAASLAAGAGAGAGAGLAGVGLADVGLANVAVVASAGAVGGGGAPGVELPGWAVRLPEELAPALRAGSPPVITRVERGHCLVDLRCVPPEQDAELAAAVLAAAARVAAARVAAAGAVRAAAAPAGTAGRSGTAGGAPRCT